MAASLVNAGTARREARDGRDRAQSAPHDELRGPQLGRVLAAPATIKLGIAAPTLGERALLGLARPQLRADQVERVDLVPVGLDRRTCHG